MTKFVEFHDPVILDGLEFAYLSVEMLTPKGDVIELQLERETIAVRKDNIAQITDDPTEIDDYEEANVDPGLK